MSSDSEISFNTAFFTKGFSFSFNIPEAKEEFLHVLTVTERNSAILAKGFYTK